MRAFPNRYLLATLAAGLLLTTAAAEPDDMAAAEIDALLTTVGSSDCVFIRNGRRYDADTAEQHLRLKLRRGKRYVTSTETFIERLASKSSMSRKPYFIQCPGEEQVPSGEWLRQKLEQQRESAPEERPR